MSGEDPVVVALAILGAREELRAGRLTGAQLAAIKAALSARDGNAAGVVCAWCGGVLPSVGRSDRRYCSSGHRWRAWRARQSANGYAGEPFARGDAGS